MRVAIVGAGAAGLSLGVMLKRDGHRVTVLEQQGMTGGLCQSMNGVDLFGPHILGGIPGAVEWIKSSTGLEFRKGETRNAGYYYGEFVAHPFEAEAIGLAYMGKMWKRDPQYMEHERLKAQAGRKPGGVSTFEYPVGGYQTITDAWTADLGNAVRLTEPVLWDTDLSPFFDRVVWTAPHPLREYLGLVTLTRSFADLKIDTDLTALYLPSPEYAFHRLSFPGNIQGTLARVVQGEMTIGHRMQPLPAAVLQNEMTRVLKDCFQVEDSEGNDHITYHAHAYPVPRPQDHMSNHHVNGYILHGRTGAHKYLNVDGVVADSMKLAEEL